MKRIILIAILLLIAFAAGGCDYKKNSEILDFDESQIESIDIYSGTLPNDIKKKRVTIPADIDEIVKSFSKMRVWNKVKVADEQVEDMGVNMCFKFDDGSEKLILINGKVVSCELGNYYVSGNMFDVVFYNSLRYPEEPVEEMDVPFLKEKKSPEPVKLPQKIQGFGVYLKNISQYIKDLYSNHKL